MADDITKQNDPQPTYVSDVSVEDIKNGDTAASGAGSTSGVTSTGNTATATSTSSTTDKITCRELTAGAGTKVFRVDINGIYAGASAYGAAPFKVDMSGNLTASSATITGIITASAGSRIGSWYINTNTISSAATEAASGILLDRANSLIRVGPTTGNYITIDGANLYIQSSTYSAGVSGFKITPTVVEAENLIARGSIKGSTFAYDVISAIGGQLMVANADVLAADMTAADASTMTIKGDTTFAVNDILLIRGIASGTTVQEEWFKVINITSAPTYTVLRDLKGDFSANANPAWKAGTPMVKQGSISATVGESYTAPTITGGTSPSATSVFDTLAAGGNDGKIKLTVNGYDYDNVAVDLRVADSGALTIDLGVDADSSIPFYWCQQTFTTAATTYFITKISVYATSNLEPDKTAICHIYTHTQPDANHIVIGTLLGASDEVAIPTNPAWMDFTFATPVAVSPSTSYAITFTDDNSSGSIKYSTTDNISGKLYSNSIRTTDGEINFKTYEAPLASLTTATIASALQTAIRATTGRLETVAYSTDHYLVTGVDPDITLSIDSPSTGTDISGSGATKYYDLGSGATDTDGGFGTGGWLRLIGEGTNSPYYSVFHRTGIVYNNYAEVVRLGNLNGFLDYASNIYGIGIGETTKYLKYDSTNGLRLAGKIKSTVYFEAGIALTAGQAVCIFTDGKVYSTDSTIASLTNTFIGFCAATTAAGSSAPIIVLGTTEDQSSMSIGVPYYLNDCTQNIDQQNTDYDGYTNVPESSESAYQSFTVGNGITHLTKVVLRLHKLSAFDDNCTVNIRTGEGTGGTLLGSATVSVNAEAEFTFLFDTFIPLVAGNKYSITARAGTVNRVGWDRWSGAGDKYAGGRNDGSTTSDYYFKTYYGTNRGKIGTSAGSTSKKIGLSLSATELLILNS